MVMPGDNVKMAVTLINPVAMDEGLRFAIREGGRTVGAGVVAKIIKLRTGAAAHGAAAFASASSPRKRGSSGFKASSTTKHHSPPRRGNTADRGLSSDPRSAFAVSRKCVAGSRGTASTRQELHWQERGHQNPQLYDCILTGHPPADPTEQAS